MVCPFLCVVMIPSGFRGGGGVSFFSVNGSLLSVGAEKGFPVIGKSLSAVGYFVSVIFTVQSRRLAPFSSPGIPAL